MGGTPALLGASIGTQALGAALGARNMRRAQRASDRVYDQEYARQQGYQQQAAGEFDTALDTMQRPQVEAREQQAMERRQALANDLLDDAQITSPATGREPAIVRSAFNRELGNAIAQGRDFSRRFAALGAPTDARLAESISAGRTNQALGQFAKTAGNSAALAPGMANEAARRKLSPWPDMINAIGGLGTLYSFSRPQPDPETILSPGATGLRNVHLGY